MEKGKHIKWIKYKDTDIISISFAGLSGVDEEDALNFVDKVHEFVINAGSNLRILANVEGSYANANILKQLKENVKTEKEVIYKEAVLGIVGPKKALLRTINLFSKVELKPFDNKEEALEWLIKD